MRQFVGKDRKETVGEHLLALVEAGRTDVAEELAGPDVPDVVLYLWERFMVLDGMRGIGFDGPAPFTPEMLKAADDLFGWELTPQEVIALRQMDIASRVAIPETREAREPTVQPAWPERKAT